MIIFCVSMFFFVFPSVGSPILFTIAMTAPQVKEFRCPRGTGRYKGRLTEGCLRPQRFFCDVSVRDHLGPRLLGLYIYIFFFSRGLDFPDKRDYI